MKNLLIFGVGLIGGSIALKVKKDAIFDRVIGVSRNNGRSLDDFVKKGMLDEIAVNVEEAISTANFIIIATPVAQTKNILKKIYPYLNADCLVTDVGSTKSEVMLDAAESLGDKFDQFIGSHPIAGSEKHGPDAADEELFEGKNIIITPHSQANKVQLDCLWGFWECMGGIVSSMTPSQHDEIFSTVSHLPHLLAFALVNLINKKNSKDQLLEFAASGFRDFSRIAASSPEVWRDISLANKKAIISDLTLYKKEIDVLVEFIDNSQEGNLNDYLSKASSTRSEWAEDKK
ncbi:MAG: prephenate dehydrogenase/arogenate dehydrogenase family protein [Nitrosomonadales bacterium]|nr:prephenate dehydrogenase/arogenate dehydrogenase family protein [Nitrosomonadales bacterium]